MDYRSTDKRKLLYVVFWSSEIGEVVTKLNWSMTFANEKASLKTREVVVVERSVEVIWIRLTIYAERAACI